MSRNAKHERGVLPVACDPTALSAEQRERKRSLQRRLRANVKEIWELPDGYAFRHSSEPSMLLAVAEFVSLERLCCPFFDFRLELERGGGPLWFRITGSPEAKRVLRPELDADAC